MPSRELVKKAVQAMKRAADVDYFFDSLTSPEWIVPLEAEGLFRHPPEPERENQFVRFPLWPQSRYLKRMAAAAPKEVLKTILEIPLTENVRVHEDFVDAASAMPAVDSVELASRVVEWLSSPYQLLLPDKAGLLMVSIAQGNKTEPALHIMRALLAVEGNSEQPVTESDEEDDRRPLPHARGRYHDWQYSQILKNYVPSVVAAAGTQALQVLCDLLETAIERSLRRPRDGADYSYVWRPAIEDDSANNDFGVREYLVSAVRDAAVAIVKTDPSQLPLVLETLGNKRWQVFRRIRLHLLAENIDQALPLAAEEILAVRNIDDSDIHHEFWRLAQIALRRLDVTDQERFNSMLDDALRLDQLPEVAEELAGTPVVPEERARRRHYRRLVLLGDALPASRRDELLELEGTLGPLEHPGFLSHTGVTWVGPTSPKSREELARMRSEELVSFLRQWRHSGRITDATPEGLGRTLAEVVRESPEALAKAAAEFRGLDPTYVRGLLQGLVEACKAKRTLPWAPVLDLCLWVVDQKREPHDYSVAMHDADPDWSWARKAVAELLSAGFDTDEQGLGFEMRGASWKILSVLSDDPDPTAEYEARYGGTNLDPMTMSINTTRGEAMHTVFRYALWVRRHLDRSQTGSDQSIAHNFDDMPEVRDTLDAHLDPGRDPSVTIRAVYGRWFPWLLLLDEGWTRQNVARVFPPDSDSVLWYSAWNAYVVFGGMYNNVLPVLLDEYQRATRRIATLAQIAAHVERPDQRLAEHVMVFYWRGLIPLDDPEHLARQFYVHAPAELRGHALGFIGRALQDGEDTSPIATEVLERLKTLWQWRVLESGGLGVEDRAAEMSEFGWWFTSPRVPTAWSLPQLIEALRIAGRVEAAHLVLERLGSIALSDPQRSIEALTLLVQGDTYDMALSVGSEHVSAVLNVGLADVATSEQATDLIHLLVAKGHREYAQLLGDSSQPAPE